MMLDGRVLRKRGFTLVELLIVIVVIGTLVALVVNSFAGVQAKERDYLRQSDVDEIAKQLEACYDNGCKGSYPSLIELQDVSDGGWLQTNLPGFNEDVLYDTNYMLIQDSAPSGGGQYQYTALPNGCTGTSGETPCTSFSISAHQELGSNYTKYSLH